MTDFQPVGSALPPRRDVQLVEARDAGPATRLPGGGGSIVVPEARDRLLELFERDWPPKDVKTVLGSSLFGDLRDQQLLFQAMIDTWPRLQKALREVKLAARKAPWTVEAWAERGEEPDARAEELAKEIEGMIWRMKPDPIRGLKGFEGLIEALTEGYFAGHQVAEIHWMRARDGRWLPQAARVVPPRFYGYPTLDAGEDRLMLDPEGGWAGQNLVDFPPHRFLVAVNGGHAGHPAAAAPLRCLAAYWLATVYGLRWGMIYAQLFGVPFRWATYADDGDKRAVSAMLAKIGTAGWAAFKKGTELNIVENSKGAQQLPQWKLVEMADEQCDIFILGQTLTSSEGKQGSRALGEVHMGVRRDLIEGVCDFVGEVLTHQLVPSLAALNFGDGRDDLPGIWAKFEDAKDEKAMAERDEVLRRAFPELEWSVDQVRKRHGVEEPKGADDTFRQGPNGAQGDPATGDEPAPHETKARLEGADARGTWESFSESLGIPRTEMPQVGRDNRSAMVQFLRARGAAVEREDVDPAKLRASQSDFRRDKVDAIREAIRAGSYRPAPILVAEDDRVLDGHHQWLANREERPGEALPIFRVSLPASRALMMLHRMPSTKVAAADAGDGEVSTPDRLSAAVLEGLTGVSRQWLGPVRPFFDRLAALAMSNTVTDEDFLAALEKARAELPELFEVLDTQALEEAFEEAVGSAMLAGSWAASGGSAE